jgi:aerobic carbon-monoxide dehydrogenase medium subunit
MKSAPFDYVRPKTVIEASALLAQDGVNTAAIAGGQSLVPMLNLRVAQIDLLVDLSHLEELKGVSETSANVQIGALTTHAAIEDGKTPDCFSGLMRRVASTISYRAVRNHGTIGGSVALADPAADWPGCLIALDANVRIAGRDGTRQERMADFVKGAYTTALATGEIILGFDLPRPDAAPRWGLAKVVRKSGAFANSIAFVVARGKDGPVAVVLAAAGSRPYVLTGAARQLANGAVPDDGLRAVIGEDLKTCLPDADAYQVRLHTSTVMRAARDMRTRSWKSP